jgi:ABC-3C protein
MTPEQRHWWRIALELKLRKSSGDAFQDFFSTVMTKAHGSDFVRVRPFGVLGDKGCDGYLQSLGHVYQCYGALNGDSGKVAYLIGKMANDFAKALAGVPEIMKAWHMVHNLVDGLPIEAVLKLKELEAANISHSFGFIGIEGFEERIFALELSMIEDLLGVVATNQDAQNLQAAELRDLVANVAKAADEVAFDPSAIRRVPSDKLEFNKLPNHWRFLITNGWQNAHLVEQYLARHHDPLIGGRIAQAMRVRYEYLKTQGLSPGAIMASLYELVTGIGSVTPSRQVAAHALLAFLFESCDIFEDDAAKVVS